MKRCEYCGGNAESGCGAVETATGLYLHYSKIECAEILKMEVTLLRSAIDKSNIALEAAVKTKEERDRLLLQVSAMVEENGKMMLERNGFAEKANAADRLLSEERERCAKIVEENEAFIWTKPDYSANINDGVTEIDVVASMKQLAAEIRRPVENRIDPVPTAQAIKTEAVCPKCRTACCVEKREDGKLWCDYCMAEFIRG